LCHLARLPFSIVGESAGINTWIGMDALTPEQIAATRTRGGLQVQELRA
jgi:hypothetical protein